MADRFRCSVASLEHAEAVAGTASTVRRWFVVEQPGSWGPDAVVESAMPSQLAAALRTRARQARVRLLLIRGGDTGPRRRAYAAFSGPGGAWLESHDVDDPAALLDIDLDALQPGGTTGGERLDDPVVLTCTNGRHDACCAEFGRPTAAALQILLGTRAWEVSHIGGDRFAPNVLVLPHGLYHGRVAPTHAPDFAEAIMDGRVWLPGYRGRSIHPFPVQAAEAAVRRARNADGVDAVQVVDWREHGSPTSLRVQLAAQGQRWQVDVETRPHDQAWPLTCMAAGDGRPPVHRVSRLEPLGQDESQTWRPGDATDR